MENQTKTKKHYTSIGLVYGNYWGGGEGGYAARRLSADTKEELLELAKKGVEDGSLDSGMGYKRVLGALLGITETETIVIDGKEFHHDTSISEFVGELTEKQQDFLLEVSMNY